MFTILAATYWGYIRARPTWGANYYAMLGEAFLSGETYLKVLPSAELLSLPDPYDPQNHKKPFCTTGPFVTPPSCLWDASLYKGKYFLYFGPVPGLIWAAAKTLTGISLSDPYLTLGFSTIGTGCLMGLLFSLAVRNRIASDAGLVLATLSLGLGTWLPFLLRRASFYEAAIAGAYCFSALGFLFLWRSFLSRNDRKPYWLTLAGACFGLAVGCRLTHMVNGLILAMAWFGTCRREEKPHPFASFICLFAPWGLCIAGLALYNYMRFDSLFETGFHYQLTAFYYRNAAFHITGWDNVIPHAYYYLFRLLPWHKPFVFPFFDVTYSNTTPLPLHIIAHTREPVYGLFTNSPFTLWLFAAPYCWGKRQMLTKEMRLLTIGIGLYGLLLLSLLLLYFFTSSRFEVDFSPWLMLFAGIQYLQLLSMAKTRLGIFLLLAAGITTAFYGAFAGSISGFMWTELCRNLPRFDSFP